MTEDEAKKKWCPFARVTRGHPNANGNASVPSGQPVFNRLDLGTPNITQLPPAADCIGSACMAWRQVEHVTPAQYEVRWLQKPAGEINPPFSNCPEGFSVSSHDSRGYYQADKLLKPKEVTYTGYCGLAGKPHD